MPQGNGRSFFMLNYFWVRAGGALGIEARFWASGIVARRFGEFFPLGTLAVNVTGSFIIGLFAALTDPQGWRAARPAIHDRRLRVRFALVQTLDLAERLVEGRSERHSSTFVLHARGVAGADSRPHSHSKLERPYEPTQRRCPSENFYRRERSLETSASLRSNRAQGA